MKINFNFISLSIKRYKDLLFILAGGLFLTFSKRIVFLYGNQSQYFPYGLRLFDSKFIPRDWSTWETFHHDFAFGYLLYLLQKLGSLFITVTITQLVVMIFLSLGLLLLCRRFAKHSLLVYLALIVWIRITNLSETGLGGSILSNGYLQPSEIASSLMILGLAFLYNYNFFISGIVLGLAGLFHGAYLFSFGPTILITALAMGVLKNRRNLFSLIVPLGILWGTFILIVAKSFLNSSAVDPKVMTIMTQFRAPGDYIISNWSKEGTLNWLIWVSMGLIVLLTSLEKKKFKVVLIGFVTAIITCAVGIIQTLFLKIEPITAIMLWRVSSILPLLSLLLVLDRTIQIGFNSRKVSKKDVVCLTGLCFAMIILSSRSWGPHVIRARFLWLVAVPLAGVLSRLFHRPKIGPILFLTIMIIIMGVYLIEGLRMPVINNYAYPSPASLAEMQKWVRENTPEDSILAIPPTLDLMRIQTRRAVIVDLKQAYYRPSDLSEWYQRLCAISGLDSTGILQSPNDLIIGYNHLDTNRAKILQKRYGADYIVVLAKDHLGNLDGLKEVFSNEDYRVLKITLLGAKES